MYFLKFPHNDLLPTCCGLGVRTSPQLPRLRGGYGETCVMDFGNNRVTRLYLLVSW